MVWPLIVPVPVAAAARSAPETFAESSKVMLTFTPAGTPSLLSCACACALAWSKAAWAVAGSLACATRTLKTFKVCAPYTHDLLAPPPVTSSLPAPNEAPARVDASELVTIVHGSIATGVPAADGLGDGWADAAALGDGDPDVEPPHAEAIMAVNAKQRSAERRSRTTAKDSDTIHGQVGEEVVTVDDVRAVASRLPRSYEAVVRGRVKFRVGRIVYIAFSRDQTMMGFAFPKDEREWLIGGSPDKFLHPSAADLRYHWVESRLAALELDEMRELIEDAWRMVVPRSVAAEYEAGKGIKEER